VRLRAHKAYRVSRETKVLKEIKVFKGLSELLVQRVLLGKASGMRPEIT
jgi:hypothetical protein